LQATDASWLLLHLADKAVLQVINMGATPFVPAEALPKGNVCHRLRPYLQRYPQALDMQL